MTTMMRMKTTVKWTGAVLAALVLAAGGAEAQVRPRPQIDRGEMEQQVRIRFAQTVRAELGLTGAQLERLEQVVASFQDRRLALVRREMALRQRLRQVTAGGRTDEGALRILQDMAAVREEESRLFQGEMDDLLQTLTPGQTLRFYELRERLMDRVRLIRQTGPGSAGSPGLRGPAPRGR